jgi:chemotaxis protein CheD
MGKKSDIPALTNYFLKPGYIFLPSKSVSISTVLGSSVSVCIFDQRRKVGGMNHFKLPYTRDKHIATPIYGNVATLALIRMMLEDGSKLKHLEAQIFGGAHNYKLCPQNIGLENSKIARRILVRKGVPVVSEDVGGMKGRKVVFSTSCNEIVVLRVERLRKSDWYPYDEDR